MRTKSKKSSFYILPILYTEKKGFIRNYFCNEIKTSSKVSYKTKTLSLELLSAALSFLNASLFSYQVLKRFGICCKVRNTSKAPFDWENILTMSLFSMKPSLSAGNHFRFRPKPLLFSVFSVL